MMRRDRRGEMGVAVWAGLGPALGTSGAGSVALPAAGTASTMDGLRPDLRPGQLLSCLYVNCDSIARQRAAAVTRLNLAELVLASPASDRDYVRAAEDYANAFRDVQRLEAIATRCC